MTDAQLKTRTAAVSGTGRTTFRLDASTWDAIDRVADQAGQTWIAWATAAVAKRPHRSKAAALRAALADCLLNAAATKLIDDLTGHDNEVTFGECDILDDHPIVGSGYHILDDQAFQTELDSATITARDGSFEGFEFIVGYRGKTFGGEPFIAIKNRLRDAPHLFIAPEAGK